MRNFYLVYIGHKCNLVTTLLSIHYEIEIKDLPPWGAIDQNRVYPTAPNVFQVDQNLVFYPANFRGVFTH